MREIEVAVVEPKYQINLGYIARVSKNFGVERLILVSPRCNHKGKEAIKYSKHARELLEGATILKSLKTLGSDLIIGTTGIWHKTDGSYYNVYRLGDISKFVEKQDKSKKITLLLGRDDTGLSKKELRFCDATVFIETNKEYPILNISHALAIMLYALTSPNNKDYSFMSKIYADSKYQQDLLNLFGQLVKSNPRIRDKKSVKIAFRHILRRANPTKKEINALAIALAIDKTVRNRKKR